MSSSLIDRSDYPTVADSVYLNQASQGLIGRPAVDAMHQFLDGVGRHGNLYMSDEDEAAFLDALRERAADLFGTETRRIAILSSASELLGQASLMFPPPPGAEVVFVASDFPAITRPWLRLAEGEACRLHFVKDNPQTDLTDDLIARIGDRTSMVAVSSVQYATGSVIDVPRLRAATKEAGRQTRHRRDPGRRCYGNRHRAMACRYRGFERIQMAGWPRWSGDRRPGTGGTRNDPAAAGMDGRSQAIRLRRHPTASGRRRPSLYPSDDVIRVGGRPHHRH